MKTVTYLRLALPCALVVSVACGSSRHVDAEADAGTDVPTEDTGGSTALDGGKISTGLDSSLVPVKTDAGRAGDGAAEVSSADSGNASDGGVASDKSDGAAADTQPDGAAQASDKLRPKCVQKPSQVMILGDSYINWVTHTFGDDLAKEAGQRWRMEAVGGYSMGSGGIGFIPDEYAMSIADDPDCHTILMDGGGNDVLVADANLDPFNDCKTDAAPTLMQCQTIIDKALSAADAMLQKASAAGIRDVVYFFYPHVPNGTLLGGDNPNAILDKALPQVKAFCDGVEAKTAGKTRCHFLDLVPVFEGHTDWFVAGDIHENSSGSEAMAKAVWNLMKDKCVGQLESSGCCEP